MNEIDGHDPSKLEKATESTLAKAFNRFVTPVMLGIITYFLTQARNDIVDQQIEAKAERTAISMSLGELRTDVKLLNAKVDFSVLQKIDTLERRINSLERTPRATYNRNEQQ